MANKTNTEINGNKYYRIRKVIGKKLDGTPVLKSFYGINKTDAENKANTYMEKMEKGIIETDLSFEGMMHKWLFEFLYGSSSIKSSSFARYDSIYNKYIKNTEIGSVNLVKINTFQLQEYCNELSKNHTYNQIATVRRVLVTFFNWCIKQEFIIKNPASNIVVKGNKAINTQKQKATVEILSDKEIKKIKNYIKDTDFELLFILDLSTGLRQGELLALNWEDIDLKNQTLKVDKAYEIDYFYENEKRKKRWIITSPKTLNSYRTLPIPDETIKFLKKHKSKGKIFEWNGNSVYKRWITILKNCKIPHKKFHCIRHTYGSILLQNGVDIQTVAELMGHTAIGITQIYMHSTKELKTKEVNKLNAILKT